MVGYQYERNELLLSSFQGGGLLLDGYDAAREVDPRLDAIEILPITDPEQVSLGRAVAKWSKSLDSDIHQVRLRLDDPTTVSRLCDESIRRDPTSYRIMSERMGVAFDRLTSQVLSVLVELHELGHASQYFDYENDPEALAAAISAERRTLPFDFAPPSYIATEGSQVRRHVEANWDRIRSRVGVTTIEELVERQAIAYRDMPTEASADYFAAEVLSDNPSLMDVLLAGGAV